MLKISDFILKAMAGLRGVLRRPIPQSVLYFKIAILMRLYLIVLNAFF